MGYHHVVPADLEPGLDGPSTKRSIGAACGLSRLAARVCEVASGEEVPLTYHYHDEQEGRCYGTEGALHVETPEREYVVSAGEAFVCEPESPQFAAVPGDGEHTTALVVRAPPVDDVHAHAEP